MNHLSLKNDFARRREKSSGERNEAQPRSKEPSAAGSIWSPKN